MVSRAGLTGAVSAARLRREQAAMRAPRPAVSIRCVARGKNAHQTVPGKR